MLLALVVVVWSDSVLWDFLHLPRDLSCDGHHVHRTLAAHQHILAGRVDLGVAGRTTKRETNTTGLDNTHQEGKHGQTRVAGAREGPLVLVFVCPCYRHENGVVR